MTNQEEKLFELPDYLIEEIYPSWERRHLPLWLAEDGVAPEDMDEAIAQINAQVEELGL